MSQDERDLIRVLYKRETFIEEVYRRLPDHGTLVAAYWDVEYDHETYFGCTKYSGIESFKTVLSKRRRRRFPR